MAKPFPANFWEKVDRRSHEECWEWQGARTWGYGTFGTIHSKTNRAHRVSWEICRGPIPEGMYVLHRCDNPPCVNPGHLFLGTQMDNMADMIRKGRSGKRGGKLTSDDRAYLIDLYLAGTPKKDIARKLGVDPASVRYHIRKKGLASL